MRKIDLIKRAGKNIKRAKIRTFLTSLAIAVGATTIILALSAGKGGRAYIDHMLSKIGDKNSLRITIKPDEKDLKKDSKPKKISDSSAKKISEQNFRISENKNSITDEDVKKISQVDGVKNVSPVSYVITKSVRAENGEKFEASINSKTYSVATKYSAGKVDDKQDLPKGKVIIPKNYVESFGFSNPEQAIGKKIIFELAENVSDLVNGLESGKSFEKEFEIVAVDAGKTDSDFLYVESFKISNDDILEISRRQISGELTYGVVMADAKDGVNIEDLKQKISSLEGGKFRVDSFADLQTAVNGVVIVAMAALSGFGALAILASVFGVINTQYINVLERTSQIGLMKSLGMKNKDVAKLFRYEAAITGLIGGLIGLLVAALVCSVLNPIIVEKLKTDGIELLQLDHVSNLILIISLMIISVIAGWLPSRKAAKMNPIEALRTE